MAQPWPSLTYQQAKAINQTIDRFHEPYYWISFGVLAIIFSYEIFLPPKKTFVSLVDKILTYIKFSIILLMALVAISQGFAGGCIIQIPQNWLARTYMGREYWYPYGLVFREVVPQQYWFVLRIVYATFGFITPFVAYTYWKKRIRSTFQDV